jgi:hypothetical protein
MVAGLDLWIMVMFVIDCLIMLHNNSFPDNDRCGEKYLRRRKENLNASENTIYSGKWS